MSYHLFLDDIRDPHQVTWVKMPWFPGIKWEIVRSYDQFVAAIESKGIPAFVAFDHDLGIEHYLPEVDPKDYVEKTGRDCAQWLVNRCIDMDETIPSYVVHSMNPIGRDNIKSIIESAVRYQDETRKDEAQLRRTDT